MLRQPQVINELLSLGFHYSSEESTGYTFNHNSDDICLIIDTKICKLQDYHYIDYTNRQNHLFSQHAKVLRLLYTEDDSLSLLIAEIQSFLSDSFEGGSIFISRRGSFLISVEDQLSCMLEENRKALLTVVIHTTFVVQKN